MKYEFTRRGLGFQGRHPMSKNRVLRKMRSRVRRLKDPYTINGDNQRYNIDGVMTFLRNHIDHAKPGARFEVAGSAYDQPVWIIKCVEVAPPNPMVKWAEKFVGKSPYLLGATGPPGQSDCSSTTMNAAREVYNKSLEHGAELQRQDDVHLQIFHDASEIEEDDFIFFNYGRLAWPQADHVEIIAKRATKLRSQLNIGSRPSTNGVNWYRMSSYDKDNIVAYGRLRK